MIYILSIQPRMDWVQTFANVGRLVEPDAAEQVVDHRPVVSAALAGESPESCSKKRRSYSGSSELISINHNYYYPHLKKGTFFVIMFIG